MRKPLGKDYWRRTAIAKLPGGEVLEASVREHPSTIVAQEAVLSFKGPQEPPAKMLMAIAQLTTPKNVYLVGCTAEEKVFRAAQGTFRKITDSFSPKDVRDSVVNANPSPAVTPVGHVEIDAGAQIADHAARLIALSKAKPKKAE
jgi:hypothetical protein